MAETKFTPGPWYYERITIGDPDNWKNPIVDSENEHHIARLFAEGARPGMVSLAPPFDEAEANAHLIAAAPDMYAALEPFAHMAELFLTRARPPMGSADDAVIYEYRYGDETYCITVGDCRDAYTAMRAARGEAS